MPSSAPPHSGTPQQRAYVRVTAARLPARLWVCQPRVATVLDCVILNLSGDGAYIEVDTRGMAPGCEVHFDFVLPGGQRVGVSGRVVRLETAAVAANLGAGARPCCALRFVFYREAERDRLVRWVFEALAKARRRSLQAPELELAEGQAQPGGPHQKPATLGG